MKLDKTNVCVFIENEAHLQQARELLERYGEQIDDRLFYFSYTDRLINNLQYKGFEDVSGWWTAISYEEEHTKITLTELEEILKEEV